MKIVNENIKDLFKGKEDQLEPWLEKKRMIKEMVDIIGPYLDYIENNQGGFRSTMKKINNLFLNYKISPYGIYLTEDLEELSYEEIKKIYGVFISLNIQNFYETGESRKYS